MAEQLQVAEVLYDPNKDKDLTAEYARFRELTKELSSRPEDIRMGSADFAKVVFFLDHYSRMNLWSEFFPIPPELMTPKAVANYWGITGRKGTSRLSGKAEDGARAICKYATGTCFNGTDSPERQGFLTFWKIRKWIQLFYLPPSTRRRSS